MKLVTFTERGKQAFRVGVVITEQGNDFVVDLSRVDSSLPRDMRALLQAMDGNFTPLKDVVDKAPREARLPMANVSLGPVVPDPRKIIGIGLNYRDHAKETNMPLPQTPAVFGKFPNTLIGSGETIRIPANISHVDYEAELACVIGRRAKYVTVQDALAYVAGYSVFNDVSEREFQMRTSQWTLGKSFDTFGPFGPALVTSDEVPDPQTLGIRLRAGDELLQDSNTANMVFGVAELVSYLSSAMTLEPGDVIATGTPSGVGFTRKPPRFLRPGETVRVEIDRLGVLENPVRLEKE
ncbi:MAG: fumarylacetoacetate hydrolase family protein [Acidobacteriota bacterium]|nr:fumarylacetoacetate hydrolase family protein [Acidobacteriota bacterium]